MLVLIVGYFPLRTMASSQRSPTSKAQKYPEHYRVEHVDYTDELEEDVRDVVASLNRRRMVAQKTGKLDRTTSVLIRQNHQSSLQDVNLRDKDSYQVQARVKELKRLAGKMQDKKGIASMEQAVRALFRKKQQQQKAKEKKQQRQRLRQPQTPLALVASFFACDACCTPVEEQDYEEDDSHYDMDNSIYDSSVPSIHNEDFWTRLAAMIDGDDDEIDEDEFFSFDEYDGDDDDATMPDILHDDVSTDVSQDTPQRAPPARWY